MKKLLKYEFKNNKVLLMVFYSVLIITLLYNIFLGSFIKEPIVAIPAFFLYFANSIISVILLVLCCVDYAKNLDNLMYMSTPQKASSRIGASILYYTINITAFYIIIYFSVSTLVSNLPEVQNFLTKAFGSINMPVFKVSILILAIISGMLSLMQILFAITLSQVRIKNRKIGLWGILLYFVLNLITSVLNFLAGFFAPIMLNLTKPDNLIITSRESLNLTLSGNNGTFIFINKEVAYLNLTNYIFYVLAFILLFVLSAYILDKKVDK